MSAIDWLIMTVPFAAVLCIAIYARRYARDAVDFLAAGRVAGRYVISVGDVALHPLRQHGRRLVLHRVRFRLLARRTRHAARMGVARRAMALAPRLDGGRLPVLREPFAPMVLGMVCTVWFIWGGIRDLIRLFRDLGARVRDASDNGFVRRG